MRILGTLFFLSVFFVLSTQQSIAAGPLFGAVGLDPSFCKQKAARQTVVYIDDMMMVDDRFDWAKKINNKLKATLLPSERVTVVKLSPATGQSAEIWAGCWPGFDEVKRKEIEGDTHFFTQNPLEALNQQQAFFVRDFGVALTNIYEAGKRPVDEVQVSLKSPPKKQILRALSSDESRFSNSAETIRVIIYSDMLENSDLGSVYNPMPNPFPNVSEKLGSKFRRGIFYAFGVAEDLAQGDEPPEHLKAYWVETFKVMSSVLSGFGSDLNVPNSIPTKTYNYNLHYFFDGQDLEGKMVILADADNNIIDSWIGFSRLSIAGITGTFSCSAEKCKLDGTTTTSIATNSPTERLTLSGNPARLSGELGVAGTKMNFSLTAIQVVN